jgi:hypothetical protein
MEMQRAQAAQRAFQNRVRSIPITRTTRVSTVGALQGAGVVTAILPNGRRTRMRILPTVAPISEVNRLRGVVIANERRQASAITRNAKAVASLASAQTSAVNRITNQQLKSDRDLGKRLIEAHNRLDARITKELSGGSGILERHNKRLARVVKRERRRGMMNDVLVATSIPFFLAYGDREKPLTADNAILTGSTLFWLLGDDVISSFAKEKSSWQTVASIWSYGAPVANGAGLYFWFRNKQNQRFVAGITTVQAGATATQNISDLLRSKDNIKDFNKNRHTVVASLVGKEVNGAVTVRTDVSSDGVLTVGVGPTASLPPGTNVDVAWIIDTSPVATAKAS